jgi:excisionase family DNA binding protein
MTTIPNSTADAIPTQMLLTPRAAAAALAVSPRTLWGLTAPRGPIPAVRLGRAVRYPTDALRAWIAAQQRGGET